MLVDEFNVTREGVKRPYFWINIIHSAFKNNKPWGVCQLTLFNTEQDEDELPIRENKFELYVGLDSQEDFKLQALISLTSQDN